MNGAVSRPRCAASARRAGGDRASEQVGRRPRPARPPGPSGPGGEHSDQRDVRPSAEAAGGQARPHARRRRPRATRQPIATTTAATQTRGQRQHPGRARVGPGAEAVEQRHRPARVRHPVDGAPGALAQPPAHQARDRDGEQQVEGERAEAEPERPVGRRRTGRRRRASRSARSGRATVVTTCTATHTSASSDTLRCRASMTKRGQRPRRQRSDVDDAEHDARRQEHERDRRPAPRVRYQSGLGPAATMLIGRPPPASRRRRRRRRPRRRGGRQPEAASQAGAPRPRTIAAVLAMLASTHEPAATLTVRQARRAGSPVRGIDDVVDGRPPAATGARSCSTSPGRRRDRRPSGRARRVRPRWSSVTRTGQPPPGPARRRRCRRRGRPARRPRRRRDPRARRGRRPAPSPSRPGRAHARRRPARSAPRVDVTVRQPAAGGRAAGAGPFGGDRREVAVVAEAPDRPPDGRVDVAAGGPRGAQRDLDRLEQQLPTRPARRAAALTPRQLRVVAEPAAGPVDRVELAPEERAGAAIAPGVGDEDGWPSSRAPLQRDEVIMLRNRRRRWGPAPERAREPEPGGVAAAERGWGRTPVLARAAAPRCSTFAELVWMRRSRSRSGAA